MGTSGFMVDALGYGDFFLYTALLSIPALLLLLWLSRRDIAPQEIDLARVLCSLAELEETGSRGFAVGEGDWPLRGFLVKTANGSRGLRELLSARGASAQLPASQIPDVRPQPDPVLLARRAVRA